MKIAVLSGKGGTGKTFIAVNLAAVAGNALYLDCDVEEPNGHLFIKPEIHSETAVTVPVPLVDKNTCTACRACVDFCKYNALALIGENVQVFEDICHNCGGCMLVCPAGAVSEKERHIGSLRLGEAGPIKLCSGTLNPGEASGVPLIKSILDKISTTQADNVIIDCPPGSACTVMESIRDADYCLLVAEPTLYGAHNLQIVHQLVLSFNKPYAVLLNKCLPDSENPSEKYCHDNKIPVVGSINFDRVLASMNANAKIAAYEAQQYRLLFSDILTKIKKKAPRV